MQSKTERRLNEPFPTHHVHLVELNHVVHWTEKGFKEDLTQLIFWSMKPSDFGPTMKVDDWIVLYADAKGRLDMPPMSMTKNGAWRIWIEHHTEQHIVICDAWIETFTQFDPEADERKLFGDRKGLWR